MIPHGVLLIGAASVATGLLFAHVAHHVVSRPYDASVRTVGVAFAVAWGGLAFIAVNDGVRAIVGTYLSDAFALYSTLAILKIFANAAVVWGLGVYVTYLWAGPSRVWAWCLATFAAAHALFFLYGYLVRDPVGTVAGGWVPRLVFDGPPALPPALGPFGLVFYFLPPLVLVTAYAVFARRVRERTLRYRIAATALAVAVFQIANLFHSNPNVDGGSAVFPLLAMATLIAGLLAHATYYPPPWLARMARLEPVQPVTVGGRSLCGPRPAETDLGR